MIPVVVVLASIALAAGTYLGLEQVGRRGWIALLCRAVAGSAVGLLLVNVSCSTPPRSQRPLVLLDGSLSMIASGGNWVLAKAMAGRDGEVRLFGGSGQARPQDTLPAAGTSRLAPVLTSAAATGRPVVVITDGEIDDVAEISSDEFRASSIRVLPRRRVPDVAVTSVTGPSRITSGDSLKIVVELRSFGGGSRPPDGVRVEVREGKSVLLRGKASMDQGGVGRIELNGLIRGMSPGAHVLTAAIAEPNDSEPRDDARLHLLSVAATPGVVLVALPGDWDARFLFRALRDVASLPVRGYVELERGRWRSMTDLSPVAASDVDQAVRQADLLVLKGAGLPAAVRSHARGILEWDTGASVDGDWYAGNAPSSPLSAGLVGLPVDSFPPGVSLAQMTPEMGQWIGLTAQQGRRGAERPVILGGEVRGVRKIVFGIDGLWRWAFKGGSSEQGYRGLVAAAVNWLLAAPDSSVGRARPISAVVQRGRPVMFEWLGGGSPVPVHIRFEQNGGVRIDTLAFDGAGRATVLLDPGIYRYTVAQGGSGIVAVEEYSDEWLPRPPVLTPHEASLVPGAGRTSARERLWLFALAVLAFSGEWFARRRLGLR